MQFQISIIYFILWYNTSVNVIDCNVAVFYQSVSIYILFFEIDCKEHLKTFSFICSIEMNKLTT